MDRRQFLAAAAGTALVSGTGRVLGANERIKIATIGCGGMGNAHMDALLRLRAQGLVDYAAVCDVYSHRLDAAAAKTGGKPYRDYRKLLEDKEIDAVSIAAPDHWHARIAMDAAEAGKDVYCEKPMTYWRDLETPKAVVKTIARTGRVMQVGTQGMSGDIWELCNDRIKAGGIGKVIHAQASDCRNGRIGLYEPTSNDPRAIPGQTLDWDMWLGPAPKHAYEPGRFMAFRSYWDYSGGTVTDFFPHILTPLIRTMGLGYPRRVSSTGGNYYWTDGRQVPDIVNVTIEYPEGPSVLLLASLATESGLPMVIRGQEATLSFGGPGAIIEPQPSSGTRKQRDEITSLRGASLDEHFTDFLSCVKSRKKPRSNEVLGRQVMTALHMAVHSYLKGRAMEYDPVTEKARFV